MAWDLEYQTSIQNSMKNLRNSQKWLSIISQNQNKLPQVLTKLSITITNLSLRNIVLGKNPTNIQTILITI